jgi:Neprosin
MLSRGTSWIPAVAAALAGAALLTPAGCSSAPAPGSVATSSGDTSPAVMAATTGDEADRVHAYLESRYPSAAVRHTFHTPLGQAVDCVDFFAMPATQKLAARGEPLEEMPKPPAPRRRLRDGTIAIDPPQPPAPSEGFDEDGQERICPEGTVLQIRVTPEEIARAGGLDAYRQSRQKRPPARVPAHDAAPQGAAPTMWPCESGEFHEYAHVIADVVDTTPWVQFGMDTMAVYAPSVPDTNGDHTVGQVWMFGGTYAQDLPSDPPCTSGMDCVQTIEIGWEVEAPNPNAHVITYSTTDGYTAGGAGCFNGESGGSCPPFVWSSGYTAAVTPGAIIPVTPPQQEYPGEPATLPVEETALIIYIGGNYWVQIGVGGHSYYIGYYPGSNFSKELGTFQVGGEVYDGNNDFTNPPVPMGDGIAPIWGYGWAAYHHDFNAAAWVNGAQQNYWGAQSMCDSTPPDYDAPLYSWSKAPPPGNSSWDSTSYFYYGGTPSSCTPLSCSAAGVACGTTSNGCGQPMSCGSCAGGRVCEENACMCPNRCPVGFLQNPVTCACTKIIQTCGGKGQPLCQ